MQGKLAAVGERGLSARADLLLAVGLAGFAVVDLWVLGLTADFDDHRVACTLPALVVPGTLVWRGRRPLPAAVLAALAVAVQTAWVANTSTAQLVTLLLLAFALGVHEPVRAGLAGVSSMVAAVVWLSLASGASGGAGGLVFIPVALGVPWAAGRAVGSARAYAGRLAAVTQQLVLEHGHSARLAVMQERARIARELHDVVAHGVGVITLQAAGAQRVIVEDPVRAGRALADIEATARVALSDLERALAVLRQPDEDTDASASLSDLPALVSTLREAGQDVELELEELDPPPALGIAIYRIVQEALTNARKHAPGASVRAIVRRSRGGLELEVVDDGSAARPPSGPGGHGLIGMRERVELFDGTLEVGPTARGGFRVAASLPASDAMR